MADKGHRRIGTHLEEHQDEYSNFYDYSTSYNEVRKRRGILKIMLSSVEFTFGGNGRSRRCGKS